MKLIVLDCDGVLSKGEAHPFDTTVFARLARLNQQAWHDQSVPAVTLNTGRPSPYVEAVMQAIDGWQPALYENGAGLYSPQTYQFETTPLLKAKHQASLKEIIQQLDETIVKTKQAYWQPGKTVCYTLFAVPPFTIDDFSADIETIVHNISPQFAVTTAGQSLNIHPTAISKGTGLRWLSQVTGIPLEQMGGVGDTAGDIHFLRLVGDAAAPSNATEAVKSTVQYISPYEDAQGLNDILDHWSV